MHALWTGSLVLGLVNIPVKLYSAVESQSLSFTLLDSKDHARIRYQRVNEKSGKEVEWGNIVKGYEAGRGKYYILTKDAIEALKPTSTDVIEIKEFVSRDAIDPVLTDKHYFVAPAEKKEKAYFLFVAALEQAGKVAIGQFVMREREHVVMIQPYQQGLLLTTLHFARELRDVSDIDELSGKPRLSDDELQLAELIIDKHTHRTFKIDKYKDSFAENLKKAVKGKPLPKKREITRVDSLMDALRDSVK